MARFLSAVSVAPQPKTSEKAIETTIVLATVLMKMSDTQTNRVYTHTHTCETKVKHVPTISMNGHVQ